MRSLRPLTAALLTVNPAEVTLTSIRAQGAGGQNVNKVSSAVHLRFDIGASSLPPAVKARLLALADQRITADGVVVIKAQAHRSLEMNRADALARLHALVQRWRTPPRVRARPSRPTARSCAASKARRSAARSRPARGRVDD